MLLDAGATTGWVDFHNVLAVHKEQPIPNAMALLATEPRLKDKWHRFLEKNQAREERSKNMSAMDLLPYINVKAGDQVCRSIEGVWVRGVVVQRHSAKIRVQITSKGQGRTSNSRKRLYDLPVQHFAYNSFEIAFSLPYEQQERFGGPGVSNGSGQLFTHAPPNI